MTVESSSPLRSQIEQKGDVREKLLSPCLGAELGHGLLWCLGQGLHHQLSWLSGFPTQTGTIILAFLVFSLLAAMLGLLRHHNHVSQLVNMKKHKCKYMNLNEEVNF